jgi:DNA modification methylase
VYPKEETLKPGPKDVTLLLGDATKAINTLPDASIDCIVTSPPYYKLRDYKTPGQLGQEATPAEYVANLRNVFTAAYRVLASDGTLWLNLGDSFDKSGSLRGMPWRVAFALKASEWTLRSEIIWHKPNGMPENVRDRLSKKHEHLFLFTKGRDYEFDLDAIRVKYTGDRSPSRRAHYGGNKENTASGVWTDTGKGSNPGSVWSINTRPYPAAHFATFPIDLPARCIKAGCKPGGTVLDPFSGSGTTGAAAILLGQKYVGIDLNIEYHHLAQERIRQAREGFPKL